MAVGSLLLAVPAMAADPSGTTDGAPAIRQAASATAATTPAAAAAAASGSASCDVTVPGGVKAVVSEAGGRPRVQLADPMAALRNGVISIGTGNGELVLPADALPSIRSGATDPSRYDAVAAATRQCGLPAAKSTAISEKSRKSEYKLGRLTVHTLDADGASTSEVVVLTNLDDQTEARTVVVSGSQDGLVKIALPLGHYSAVLIDRPGVSGAYRIVSNPDFTFSDGSSITLDERTATVEATTPSTPRPSELESSSLSITTGDTGAHQDDSLLDEINFAFSGSGPISYLFNPTAPVRNGRFGVYPSYEFSSPADAQQPYAYHITEPYDHVPSAFPTSVDASGLATATRHYGNPTGTPATALSVTSGALAQDAANGDNMIGLRGYSLVPLGTTRTEYFTARPDLYWTTAIGADAYVRDTQTTSLRSYRPGERTADSFFAAPEHPGVQVAADGRSVECAACSDAAGLEFDIYPFSTDPGTVAAPDPLLDGESEPIGMEVRRNGKLLGDADFGPQEVAVTAPKGRATYQLTEQVRRNLTTLPLSTSSSTTWTFTADPGSNGRVPADLTCMDGGRSCTALPLLFASYQADATADDALTAGPHTLSLSVDHQQDAAAAAVSGATVSVSYDDGATWVPARVTGRDGAYSAAFSVPAGGGNGYAALRVSAWDTAGDRIDQTVLRAYTAG